MVHNRNSLNMALVNILCETAQIYVKSGFYMGR